jgi:hypothetical protein
MQTPSVREQNTTINPFSALIQFWQDQDLRNCHKQWRDYTAPRAKQLHDKHGNSRTFELLN